MAIFTSTSSYSDPIKALNIKALEKRLADIQTNAEAAPATMPSPWQGAAHVMGKIGEGLQQGRTEGALASQRQALAQAIAGIDPARGPTPEQQAIITGADPELGKTYAQQIAAAREAQLTREQQTRENQATRDVTLGEGERGRQQQTALASQAQKHTSDESTLTRAQQRDLATQQQQHTAAESSLTRQQQTNLALARQEFDAAQKDADRTQQSGLQADRLAADEMRAKAKEKFDLRVQENTQTFQTTQQKERLAAEAERDKPEAVKLKKALDAGEIDQATYDAALRKLTTGGAGEIKAEGDVSDQYLQSGSALNQLQRAQGILAQGIDYGLMSNLRSTIGATGVSADVPGLGKIDPALAGRTKEFNSLLNEQAIAAMSKALRGATTDFELRQFIQLLNDPQATPQQKANRLQEIINNEKASHEAKGTQLDRMGKPRPAVAAPITGGGDGGSPRSSAEVEQSRANARAAIASGKVSREAAIAKLKAADVDPGDL